MASGFRDSEGILLVEFLKRGATVNPERAVCAADIKEVKKKKNSKVSSKQEAEASCHEYR
jgi:hypothetical protein